MPVESFHELAALLGGERDIAQLDQHEGVPVGAQMDWVGAQAVHRIRRSTLSNPGEGGNGPVALASNVESLQQLRVQPVWCEARATGPGQQPS